MSASAIPLDFKNSVFFSLLVFLTSSSSRNCFATSNPSTRKTAVESDPSGGLEAACCHAGGWASCCLLLSSESLMFPTRNMQLMTERIQQRCRYPRMAR